MRQPGSLVPTTLHGRFTLVVSVTAVAVALLSSGLIYLMQYREAEARAHDTLNGLVAAVQGTAATGAYAGDRVLVAEVLDGLIRHPWVRSARVVGREGEVLGQVGSPARRADTPGGHAPWLARPLASPFSRTEVVGSLVVVAEAEAVSRSAREQATQLAAEGVALLALVTLALNLMAAHYLSNPIAELTHALVRLQPGSAVQLQVAKGHEADELGELGRAINALLNATSMALALERRLRVRVEAMESRFRRIFDTTSAGIFVMDAGGKLLHANRTLGRLLALSTERIERGEVDIAAAFHDPDALSDLVLRARTHGQGAAADLQLASRGGEPRWAHCLLSIHEGPREADAELLEGVIYDVTERRRTEAMAKHLARHDGLTRLLNRQGFVAALEETLAAARADASEVALMFIDLDGFKAINDQHGHAAGDQVLVTCAQRLHAAMRQTGDLLGRLGGDEFVVAIAGGDPATFEAVAQRLVLELALPMRLASGRSVRVSASLGLAVFPVHGGDVQALMAEADQAMYRVKRRGKNGVALPEMRGV